MPLFVTVEEVAELLRVPLSRIYEWTRTRSIPAYRAGKRLVFDRDEVLAWFRETQRVETGLSPVSSRRQRLFTRGRRRAPNRASGGQGGEIARPARGSARSPDGVASTLP